MEGEFLRFSIHSSKKIQIFRRRGWRGPSKTPVGGCRTSSAARTKKSYSNDDVEDGDYDDNDDDDNDGSNEDVEDGDDDDYDGSNDGDGNDAV